MYFLTIFDKNSNAICDRLPHADFAEAMEACGPYYEPRARGAVLNFTSEVIGKKFMRAYAQLVRLEDLEPDTARDSPRGLMATRQSNAFDFSNSYTFLIESELGARETDRLR